MTLLQDGFYWTCTECKNNWKIMEEYGIFRADSNQITVWAVDKKDRIYLEWPYQDCNISEYLIILKYI